MNIIINSVDIKTDVPNPCEHSGHFEFQPAHLLVQICLMSEEQKQLARDCAQLNFSPSITTALLNLRKGLGMPEWKDSQIENFLKVEKEEFNMLTPNSSSADKLIHSFKQRNDVNYLYVTYRPEYQRTGSFFATLMLQIYQGMIVYSYSFCMPAKKKCA